MFTAAPEAVLDVTRADVALSARLSGSMASYDWTINGAPFDKYQPLQISQGKRAVLTFTNNTAMWHPMHLHGHTFQLIRPDGSRGDRKDTAIVAPMRKLAVALIADNPGIWMVHCHNTYHQAPG